MLGTKVANLVSYCQIVTIIGHYNITTNHENLINVFNNWEMYFYFRYNYAIVKTLIQKKVNESLNFFINEF